MLLIAIDYDQSLRIRQDYQLLFILYLEQIPWIVSLHLIDWHYFNWTIYLVNGGILLTTTDELVGMGYWLDGLNELAVGKHQIEISEL